MTLSHGQGFPEHQGTVFIVHPCSWFSCQNITCNNLLHVTHISVRVVLAGFHNAFQIYDVFPLLVLINFMLSVTEQSVFAPETPAPLLLALLHASGPASGLASLGNATAIAELLVQQGNSTTPEGSGLELNSTTGGSALAGSQVLHLATVIGRTLEEIEVGFCVECGLDMLWAMRP
jgi:hypothetical protein